MTLVKLLEKLKLENAVLRQNEVQLTQSNKAKMDEKCIKIQHLEKQIKSFTIKNKFMAHILRSDESCNYYTGFPSLETFKSVYDFLDVPPDGDNVVLYNYQDGKKDDRGRRRTFSPLES